LYPVFWGLISEFNVNVDWVVYVCSNTTAKYASVLERVFKIVCPGISGSDVVTISETDIINSHFEIEKFLDEKFGDEKFIFGITPGRKTILKFNSPKVYLHLKNRLFRGELYPLIPACLRSIEVINESLEKRRNYYEIYGESKLDSIKMPYSYLYAALNRLYHYSRGSQFLVSIPHVRIDLFSFIKFIILL